MLLGFYFAPSLEMITVFMWFRGQFQSMFLEEINLTGLTLAVNRVSVDAVP